MQTVQSTASNMFSTYASFMGSVMLIRTMANDIIPGPVRSQILSAINYLFNFNSSSNQLTLVVEKKLGIVQNEVYDAAEIYLSTKIDSKVNKVKVSKNPKQNQLNLTIEKNQEVTDTFRDVKLTWKAVSIESQNNMKEKNFFELSFNKKFKDVVLNEYLPNVIAVAKRIKESNRVIKLFTKNCPYYDQDEGGRGGVRGGWGCITLDHPATFDTLAMDSQLKKTIIEDLDKFLKRKEFYKRVGKAWKRGYLLYGPPGTGKSSLIAAVANYLRFDIYDVELTSLHSDSELRRILLSTTNRSIIVIEDIDCSAKMHKRSKHTLSDEDDDGPGKLTLSGLLNFIDGLWSCCGDERIIIFTTNHKDKIDPALLRPGRMDMHIHMSYCTAQSFKTLAFNYFGVGDDHRLFSDIDGLIKSVQVTPAEVAEELLRSEDPDIALNGVVNLLKRKKCDADDVNDRKQQHLMLEEAAMEDERQMNKPPGARTVYGQKKSHGAKRLRANPIPPVFSLHGAFSTYNH